MRKRNGLPPEPVVQSTTFRNLKFHDSLETLVTETADLPETVKNSENSLVQKLDEMNPDQGPEKLILASSYQELEKDAHKLSVKSVGPFGSVISINKR